MLSFVKKTQTPKVNCTVFELGNIKDYFGLLPGDL